MRMRERHRHTIFLNRTDRDRRVRQFERSSQLWQRGARRSDRCGLAI